MLNICIPLAITSPRDVTHMVIFDMDSSMSCLLLEMTSFLSFFIRKSCLMVFINSCSCCAWDSVFSICLLLLSTNLAILERDTVPFLFFFLPEDGTGVSADRLALEESGDTTIIIDVSKISKIE